jgi:hypothetical protein
MDGDDGASAVLFAMDGDFDPRNGLFQPPSQTSAQVREKGRLAFHSCSFAIAVTELGRPA